HAQDLSPETVAIRSFNEFVRQDARVEAGLLPIADGLYVIHKKGG
ncbi:MAG: SAM-dependent methyltransferase, partial [Oligoflexus sp.]